MSARAPGICLNMIVRNEAAIIDRCLRALAPIIDYFVIVDTGSTDDTPARARATLARAHVAGEIHHTKFVDFGTTRNEALDICRRSRADFDYVLLADADMELQIDDPEFRAHLGGPAYRIRQRAGLTYDNVRLIRRDAAARYVGTTHEYLRIDADAPRLPQLWFVDHHDGASRPAKIERDLRLLAEALAHDPADTRSMFYFAQTLREAGRLDEAAAWYEQRIAAGGWDEEVWYSRWMLAICRTSAHPRFAELCEEAWQARPHRAEPLHSLAQHFRLQRDWERAFTTAEQGAAIPYPANDRLFINDRIYRDGFDEEISICGYYSHVPERRAAGRRAVLSLATRRTAPASTRELARANSRFYAPQVDEIFPAAVLQPLVVDCPPGWHPANPTIIRTGNAWLANVRLVNYRIAEGIYTTECADGIIRTRNQLVALSESLQIASTLELREAHTARGVHASPVLGYEDCRVFLWRDTLWATATVVDRHPVGLRQMVLLEIDREGTIRDERLLRSPEPGRHEKNWVPLVDDDALYFVYQTDPTIVLRYEPASNALIEVSRHVPPLALDHLRGGSQAVAVDDGWLYLTHEVVIAPTGLRSYLHRFVHIGRTFEVDGLSEPFFFRHRGIEFAAGLVRDQNRLVASFGVNDGEAWLATFSLDDVLARLGIGTTVSAAAGARLPRTPPRSASPA